ncbi:MAG: FKBP-type peptidyl-prolyl cis-trans isomerase [Bacteroidales bacterium]|nr:MAG: FKBP-type peptidyl-prolyl cis-trans isomerase [Bacteroidales bacterium]
MKFSIALILMSIFLFSCRQEPRTLTEEEYREKRKSLIEVNKLLVKKDSAKIADYIKRENWDMVETKTGLWYMIYEKGKGEKSKEGLFATIHYNVRLLDGTLCYSSDSLGPKRFKIGRGSVESGLEEGILLLVVGDKAKFIMPPHLAHGLVGDDNRIPARSIIVYDVELLSLNN